MIQSSGLTDIGFRRELNEDSFRVTYLDENKEFAFIAVADGFGSRASDLFAAPLALNEIEKMLKRAIDSQAEKMKEDARFTEFILNNAMYSTNRILSAFKVGNEEYYSGFGCSCTCLLVYDNNKFAYAHTGNTRLALIRVDTKNGNEPKFRWLTIDDTQAQKLVEEGLLDENQYYSTFERNQLTSYLGVGTDEFLNIQSFTGKLRDKDILVLSTEGIHYAYNTNAITRIVLQSETCDIAVSNLIAASRELQMPANSTAIVTYFTSQN